MLSVAPCRVAMKRMMEGTHMPEALLHDGSTIEIEIHGAGPTLLLPVNSQPVTGEQAEQMRKYGADPSALEGSPATCPSPVSTIFQVPSHFSATSIVKKRL